MRLNQHSPCARHGGYAELHKRVNFSTMRVRYHDIKKLFRPAWRISVSN